MTKSEIMIYLNEFEDMERDLRLASVLDNNKQKDAQISYVRFRLKEMMNELERELEQ